MVQPAESLPRKDPTRSYGTNPALRCPLLKSEMRAILMMVTNILREQSLKMALIQATMWSSKARLQLPTHRSAMPFCQGLRNEVRLGTILVAFTAAITSNPNFRSRSKIRYL
jgi:hypothetical protein